MDFSPDAISAFLLKHPPGDFARGDLVLAPAISFAPLVLLVTLVSFGLLSFLWFIVAVWWFIDALLIPGMAASRNTDIADRVFGRR